MTDLPAHDTLTAQLLEAFAHAIWDERNRAHAKHGKTSMEQADLLAHRRASILTEEAVECGKALNDLDAGEISLYTKVPRESLVDADQLDKELIQTAAMAYTWWANRRGDVLDPPAEEEEFDPLSEAVLKLARRTRQLRQLSEALLAPGLRERQPQGVLNTVMSLVAELAQEGNL